MVEGKLNLVQKCIRDVVWLYFYLNLAIRNFLERNALEGDSPVLETRKILNSSRVASTGYLARKWEASTSNLKYV